MELVCVRQAIVTADDLMLGYHRCWQVLQYCLARHSGDVKDDDLYMDGLGHIYVRYCRL